MTNGPTNGPVLRVAVLMGGPSRERDVSLASGAAVASALARRGHHVIPVRIAADGRWELPAVGALAAIEHASESTSNARSPSAVSPHAVSPSAVSPSAVSPNATQVAPQTPASAVARLESSGAVDVVFVALHGAFGEDGTVQGFLETLGLPYTGSAVAASALAMDKERTKEVLAHHGIVTAKWASADRAEWTSDAAAVIRRVEARVGYPAFVKPPRDGSSFGVSVANDEPALRRAIETGLEGSDGRVLVESLVRGTEVTCPVLGNRGGDLRALPLVEIVPKGREFFDFEAKYKGASEEICPARVPDDVAERVRRDSVTAHRVLGCDGISRSDFIVGGDGVPVYLETNTVPGMTTASLCPLSARQAGMSFEDLCETLVGFAIARRRAV